MRRRLLQVWFMPDWKRETCWSGEQDQSVEMLAIAAGPLTSPHQQKAAEGEILV